MPPYRDYTEWNSLQERVEHRRARRADEGRDRDESIEELFEAAIRHRFGVMISRAKLKSKGRHR